MSATRNTEHFLQSVTTHNDSTPHSDTRPNSPVLVIRNHPDYYLPGGDLFVRIDDTLFRIHSYFLIREAQAWRNLVGSTRKGKTATDPIVLNEDLYLAPRITANNFAHLLWVFYNPRYVSYDNTEEVWLQIQQLAIQWGMNEVMDLAYYELDKIEISHLEHYNSTRPWEDFARQSPDPGEEAIRVHYEDDHGP